MGVRPPRGTVAKLGALSRGITSRKNRTANMNDVPHIVKVEYLRDYVLRLTYRDGFVDDYDFASHLRGRMSSALRDLFIFTQVQIEPGGGLEWPNGFDICPTLLRYHLQPASAEVSEMQ
jgi:hypothetical protein